MSESRTVGPADLARPPLKPLVADAGVSEGSPMPVTAGLASIVIETETTLTLEQMLVAFDD
jgi:hypothetical protein